MMILRDQHIGDIGISGGINIWDHNFMVLQLIVNFKTREQFGPKCKFALIYIIIIIIYSKLLWEYLGSTFKLFIKF